MAKQKTEAVKPEVKRVRKPVVHAGPCEKNENHTATKVYKTQGRTRYCKCNDCGHTWKLIGDFANELNQYAYDLADNLDDADRIDDGNGNPVVVLSDDQAKEIAGDLRKLVETAP